MRFRLAGRQAIVSKVYFSEHAHDAVGAVDLEQVAVLDHLCDAREPAHAGQAVFARDDGAVLQAAARIPSSVAVVTIAAPADPGHVKHALEMDSGYISSHHHCPVDNGIYHCSILRL